MKNVLKFVTIVATIVLGTPTIANAAVIITTVADEFNTVSFANNDGIDDWTGSWIEDDPQVGGAGPSAGAVQVDSGFLRLNDYPNTGGEPSAAREVDLFTLGAGSASLLFDFSTSPGVDAADAVIIEVSSNGGTSYTELETITGIAGETFENRNYAIDSFISNNTRVRFRVSNSYGGSDEFFSIDKVRIDVAEIVVPEPSSLLLLGLSLSCFAVLRRR